MTKLKGGINTLKSWEAPMNSIGRKTFLSKTNSFVPAIYKENVKDAEKWRYVSKY